MGLIENWDYETITARCDECGSLCVLNRVEDIDEPGPYSGRDVTCPECGEQFWIYGDSINPDYEKLIASAGEHMRAKRYMLCVSNLAQAWEVFFKEFAYSNYLYRPFHATERYGGKRDQYNRLSDQLQSAIGKLTFDRLRNVLVNTVIKDVHPDTLEKAEKAIPKIKTEKFHNTPKRDRVAAFPDAEVREVLQRLQALQTNVLRKRVVHQQAYRPNKAEIELCIDEIGALYAAKRRLHVYTFDQWRVDPTF
jgi:hypothetical protein